MVVIGSGFGGLFGTKALRRRRRRRHDDRQDDPPPLPAAALPGRDRHPLQGEIAPPTREILSRPGQRAGAARRGHRHRPRGAHGHLAGARPRHRDAVRLPDRRGRRQPVLLRQRPLRRVRARHEEHRRRPRAARPDLRRLRDGRARCQPRRRRRPPADLRGRRRRPDRCRDGRPDRRARPPHARARLPRHQHPAGAGHPGRRAPQVLPPFGAQARRQGQDASWRSSASRCMLGAMVTDVDERGLE